MKLQVGGIAGQPSTVLLVRRVIEPMTVDSIMSHEVRTVSPDAGLKKVRSLLHEEGFHHVLVVDAEEALLGVISDRDMLRALAPVLGTSGGEGSDGDALGQPASEVMQSEPVTLQLDTAIETAAQVLLDHDVSAVPVVDGDKLAGLVTIEDLLHHYTNDR